MTSFFHLFNNICFFNCRFGSAPCGSHRVYIHPLVSRTMGYGPDRFVAPVDENLLCSVCSEVLDDAVLTPCGHSFCLLCIHTWLDTHLTSSNCPQCRSRLFSDEVRPIHSLRNIISSLELHCKNKSRGCGHVPTVECSEKHESECEYGEVLCAGCSAAVNRVDLADHHLHCDVVQTSLRSAKFSGAEDVFSTSYLCTDSATELACRVASLDLQLKRMKRELDAAEMRNRKLDRELSRARDELEAKRQQLSDRQTRVTGTTAADHETRPLNQEARLPDHQPRLPTYQTRPLDHQTSPLDHQTRPVNHHQLYDYGHTPSSVLDLSALISRHLLNKPTHLDSSQVFGAVKRCYDNYGRCGEDSEHDVHMLLATVYASNWLSDNQKLNVYFWLQSIARHRKFIHDIYVH